MLGSREKAAPAQDLPLASEAARHTPTLPCHCRLGIQRASDSTRPPAEAGVGTGSPRVAAVHVLRATHQLLEEVAHPLLVAPLLHAGGQPIVELLVDLIELRHFEEDGLNLLACQHRLRGGGSGLQRLHGLGEGTGDR